MSHNVEKNFMDIGFILLMFIPLLFFIRSKSILWKTIISFLIGIMVFFSVGTSHVLSSQGAKIPVNSEVMSTYLDQDITDFQLTMASIYQVVGKAYAPVGNVLEKLTGDYDHLTYPILLGLLYLLFFLYRKYSEEKNGRYFLGVFILFYTFFMLILAAGIIWYGFLLFPLLYLQIVGYNAKSKNYRYLFMSGGAVFIIMAYFLKVSGLYFLSDKGIGMISPPILKYNFSEISGNEIYESYFPNVGPALDRINSDTESLIYLAGTSLTYLIKNNNKRVFKDGVLAGHNRMVKKYRSQRHVNRALKASGFKYIIFSPVLYTVDQTPERTLTKKYQNMLTYLYQNPGIKLLATDRIVQRRNANGKLRNEYDMFGENKQPVPYEGTYVIYELL